MTANRKVSNFDKYNKITVIALSAVLLTFLSLNLFFPPKMDRFLDLSPSLYDRGGELISCRLNKDEKWQLPASREQVDPKFLDLLIETEDKRFFMHPGIDIFALIRASFSALTSLKVKSGGSTLTMQVVKLLEPRPRTLTSKVIEIFRALQLELHYSKDDILKMYLTLAPYGGNIQGIRAATYHYFGKTPQKLSPSEAAFLVALPQAPTKLLKNPELQKQRRNWVLQESSLDKRIVAEALTDPVPQAVKAFPRLAQHVSHYFLHGETKTLTLDKRLQEKLEHLLVTWPTEKTQSIAAIIADKSGAIRAYCGSKDYFDHSILGQVDMIKSIRSPGSTLKPFIYGLAFEEGFLHPKTIMKDSPIYFNGYTPTNFKDVFHGDISATEALEQSLNVPAVSILEKLGPQLFMSALEDIGVKLHLPHRFKRVSLPIALGGAGIRLIELAGLYNALNNDGIYSPLYFEVPEKIEAKKLFSAKNAQRLKQILIHAPLPQSMVMRPQGAGKIAFKTGTSYGHRDAIAVGIDDDHVVLVWFGRADGAPVAPQVGLKTAAPLLITIFDRLLHTRGIEESINEDPVPVKLRYFNRSSQDAFMIQFPSYDAILKKGDAYNFKFSGGIGPYSIFINGKRVIEDASTLRDLSQKLSKGFHNLVVMDSQGNRAESYFQVR